jgi:hypothetical protein
MKFSQLGSYPIMNASLTQEFGLFVRHWEIPTQPNCPMFVGGGIGTYQVRCHHSVQVLVEEGELLSLGLRKGWKVHRLGWLKMVGKQLTFEPFLTVKGQITHKLIADDKLLLLHYTRPSFRLQPDGVWKPVDPKIAQRLLRIDRLAYLDGDFDGDGLKDAITRRWLRSGNKTKQSWRCIGATAHLLLC